MPFNKDFYDRAKTVEEMMTFPYLEIGMIYRVQPVGYKKVIAEDNYKAHDLIITEEYSRFYIGRHKEGYTECINKNSIECGDVRCERLIYGK